MVRTRKSDSSNVGEDRISRLPDNLIHHILSFIDTKFAVQTCVLSKRWVSIWKSVPFLNFNRISFSNDKTQEFREFVYMVFTFRDHNTNIQKFSVDWETFEHDDTVMMNVNRWSLSAVNGQVQEISIVIRQCHDSAYEIPYLLLNCKSLRKLVIEVSNSGGCLDVVLPSSMSLPHLKELSLQGLSISNVEFFKRLFSSCPVLETLLIHSCDMETGTQDKLIVNSVSLRRFTYNCCHNGTLANIFKLNAPNLEDFTCSFFLAQDCSLEISSQLSAATLFMLLNDSFEYGNAFTYINLPSMEKPAYAKRMVKFLGAVCMVKQLTLSPGFLEVLSQAPDLLDCEPLHFCNLQYLGLRMWGTRGCLRAIAYLLKISPNITHLFLYSEESIELANVGDGWEVGLLSPGTLSYLKYVEIKEVEGCDAELKLLSYLLKNAAVLVEVVLFFRSSDGLPDRVRQVKQFKNNVRIAPTASSSINMVFN